MKSVRRRKLSVKKTLRVLLPLIILVLIIVNFNHIKYFFQSKITGYEYNTIETFHNEKIYKTVREYDYSKTLEEILDTKSFEKKYLRDYLVINYLDKENFLDNVSKLLTLGYTGNDINGIYEKLDEKNILLLLDNSYLKDIVKVINLNYFDSTKLERYLKYNNDKISYEDLVTYVNIGLDNEYYTDVTKVDKQDDLLVLVNKYNSLNSDYVPSDLEAIGTKYNKGWNNKMRHEAKVAFEEMCEGALKDGITIYSGSAYRSYSYQKTLYNNYVASNGFKKAETFSARAGYSEHQTGLATDVMNAKGNYISKDDKEYTWLNNNSYKYGFILRYPEGKEDITGYMFEEWHFRFLGKEVAKEVYDSKLTFDEYIARKS
jgi:LAS superfamily LD-carboxypeptidase LdcB